MLFDRSASLRTGSSLRTGFSLRADTLIQGVQGAENTSFLCCMEVSLAACKDSASLHTCDDGDTTESATTKHCALSQDQLHAFLAGTPLGQGLGCLCRLQLLHLVKVAPCPDHLPAVCSSPPSLAPLYENLQT